MLKSNSTSASSSARGGRIAAFRWLAAGAAVLATAAIAFGLWSQKRNRPAQDQEETPPVADVDAVVRLTPAKLKAAALHVSVAERREIQESRRVPGRIGYNASLRLEIKVPAGGVVTRVKVLPGQSVKRGDELALMASVDIGLARDEMVKAEADLKIVQRETDWLADIAENTDLLLKTLEDMPEVPDVEEQFRDKVLGDHREQIISAYSKLKLAARLAKKAAQSQGALAEKYVQQLESDREVAAASYHTVCEQAQFDAKQQLAKAQASLEHAQHALAVSREKVKLLLGPFAEIAPDHSDSALCELILRSPLTGKVEERFISDGAQFIASQPLFTLANTDTVWVSAQIYEREWAALAGGDVKEVQVETPALPGYEATGKVQFQSVGLANETRAVTLVAELPNRENRLKPGMLAWVTVPLGSPHVGIAVPTGAIMRHEEEVFVFVELEPGKYRKVDVTPGLSTAEYVEVAAGIEAGQRVVDRGAFFLKSELLLEGEEP